MPQPELTPEGYSTDEEEVFQTPGPSGSNQLPTSAVPSSVLDDIATISEELLMMYGTKRHKEHKSRSEDQNTKRQKKTLFSYFHKQKYISNKYCVLFFVLSLSSSPLTSKIVWR